MALTSQERAAVERISRRLTSPEPATYRAGGRAVAHQAIEHRGEMVRALRGRLAELADVELDDHRRGYHEALEDVLLAAETAIEPSEREAVARQALASNTALKSLLDRAVESPLTPRAAAGLLKMSAATGGRYLDRLCELELLSPLPAADGRERPCQATMMGARLATPAPAAASTASRSGKGWVIDVGAAPKGSPAPVASTAAHASSDHDPLTGTLRPDAFFRVLESQLAVHHKAKMPLCVMRVDLAGFEEPAERHPEDFAILEEYIVNAAAAIKDECGAPATISRYATDKFMVLLPTTAPAQAQGSGRALLARLEPTNAIIGIAEVAKVGGNKIDMQTVLDDSATALEQAKRNGVGSSRIWFASAKETAATSKAVAAAHRSAPVANPKAGSFNVKTGGSAGPAPKGKNAKVGRGSGR